MPRENLKRKLAGVIRLMNKRLAVFTLIFSLTMFFTLGWGLLLPTSSPAQFNYFPQEVQKFPWPLKLQNSGEIGNLQFEAVKLDGLPLFVVAVPMVLDGDKNNNKRSLIANRVARIESKIQEVIKRGFDPQTLTVSSAVLNGQNVIQVSDDKSLRPLIVGTVTSADAELHAQNIEELATAASDILKEALIKAYNERQPIIFWQKLGSAAQILAIASLLSLITLTVYQWLTQRVKLFKQFVGQLEAQILKPDLPASNYEQFMKATDKIAITIYLFFHNLKQRFFRTKSQSEQLSSLANPFLNAEYLFGEFLQVTGIEKCQKILVNRIKLLIFVRRIILIFLILIWNRTVAVILLLFPQTRALGLEIAGAPSALILIWLGVLVGVKMVEFLIDLGLYTWGEDYKLVHSGLTTRQFVRIPTLAAALKGISLVCCLMIGLISSLVLFNVPITSILAGAGILGFAISFGSQNLIKDLIAGITTLINDSYAVGDSVVLGAYSGSVEEMNLFVTRLRCANGDLITLPNGSIITVCNQTKEWSRVDYSILVATETDIPKAMDLMQTVAEQIHQDPVWSVSILDVPELLGVEHISHEGVSLRIWIKTKPGCQWKVGREFRLRLLLAFDQAGIKVAAPKQEFLLPSGGLPTMED
jgi:small conductance mechanosensitive channel